MRDGVDRITSVFERFIGLSFGVHSGRDAVDRTIRTIPEAVRAAARTFGESAAVAELGGQVLSYRGPHDRVREVAGALIASGIEPGDRVAIWSPNTHHWVLAGLGALYAGATLVPVNTSPRQRPPRPPARGTPRLAGRTFWPGRRGGQGQRSTNGPPWSPRQP